jgi:Uma2 family endonuclease
MISRVARVEGAPTMNIRHMPEAVEPDRLEQLPDGDRYELVGGIPVEKDMGAESDMIALRIGGRLDLFCLQHQLGRVFGSTTGYRCFAHDPNLLRRPDASFIANGRLPNNQAPKGDVKIAPDLAVEVVSPNDLYEEVEAKVNEYLAAGVKLVWVVSPGSKTVLIRRADRTCALVRESGELSGEDVVPGFTCKVAELFV